jgi:hypothetical protein
MFFNPVASLRFRANDLLKGSFKTGSGILIYSPASRNG